MSFWKSIFISVKKEVWKAVAKELGGSFEKGSFFKADKLFVPYKKWEIMIDTYTESSGNTSTTYTRFRVPFKSSDNLQLELYRENFFSSIGKLFNMQDIKVGDINFDKHFIIRGSDEFKILQLFSNPELKQKLLIQKNVSVKINTSNYNLFGDSFPNGVNALCLEASGVIKRKDELHNCVEAMKILLDGLVKTNSAEEYFPNFRLS